MIQIDAKLFWMVPLLLLALGFSGCGGSDGKSISCSCSIYANNQPVYPNDTQESCGKFGQTFGCTVNTLDQCDSKNCCNVRNCASACTCPSS